MIKKILIFLIFVLIINIDLISAENSDPESSQTKYLSSRLGQLYKLHAEKKEHLQFAGKSAIRIIEDRAVVTISVKPGLTTAEIDEEDLRTSGVRIQAKAGHSMRVEIPINELVNVSTALKDVADIRLPITPVEHEVTSEGVSIMNANSWQDRGYYGAGVKVAIIDGGFDSLTEAQAAGDIPATYKSFDFTGSGLETTTPHGTAVAEAIFDLAPQAEFYLYKISDATDLENATDSCISNGVDIVNHSMGWFNALGYYDGTGAICSMVDNAISHGIVWVNSAGNSARHHYRAVFSDNGHNRHIFNEPDDTINPTGPYNAGQYISICMNWDKYLFTDQDYDLYLAKDTGSVTRKWVLVDSSTNRQSGGSTIQDVPQESITFENSEDDAMYGLLVKRLPTTVEDVDFTLFSLEQRGLSYYTESSSLTDPGTITDVVTVGAINRLVYNTTGAIESFSSQGPTTDDRIKPDVAAPDNCISHAYGYWWGTSLASPHTAGICALIKSRFPSYSDTNTREYLYNNCTVDLGTSGKDNIYGYGKIVMPDIAITVNSPNGGETWYVDSTNNITWTSSGTSGGIKIEYSLNNGASWSDVIASMPDTGTYPWVIPNTPSDNCLVRVTDTTGSPSDTSNAVFEISHPTPNITVTSPNGGEVWYVDSTYNITWTSFATSEGVQIEYSSDNGASWSDVIASMPDTGTCPWTIPNTPSDTCLVRITDTAGSPSDISDAVFTITPASGITTSEGPNVYSMVVKTIITGNQVEVNYGLPEKADVKFEVYDIKGTKIKEISEERTSGFYSIQIKMTDKPAGIYFIKMEATGKKFTKTAKVVLVR